jgi:hypothetical protein
MDEHAFAKEFFDSLPKTALDAMGDARAEYEGRRAGSVRDLLEEAEEEWRSESEDEYRCSC